MLTIWNTGATNITRNATYMKKVPRVIVPASMRRAPKYMISALTSPCSTVAERLITEVAVRVFKTLSSSRRTPPANDTLLAFFGVITLDDADPGERFRQPPRDLGIQFRAGSKDRPNRPDGFVQADREGDENGAGHHGHECADAQQDRQRKLPAAS